MTELAALRGGTIAGTFKREHGLADPLSGLEASSFWPTREGLWAMRRWSGWTVESADLQPGHQDGPAVTLMAARATA